MEQISPLLVRSNHQNLPVSMPLLPSYLIHQHPLLPAGIRKGAGGVKEFH